MTKYKKAKIDLIEWIMLRFCAVTILLGCLRSEQFNRFREGGLSAIEWLRANRDHQGRHRPVAANVFVTSCPFGEDSLFVYSVKTILDSPILLRRNIDSNVDLQPGKEQERTEPSERGGGLPPDHSLPMS